MRFDELLASYQAEAEMKEFLGLAWTADMRARVSIWLAFHGVRLSVTHRNDA